MSLAQSVRRLPVLQPIPGISLEKALVRPP